MILLVTTYRLTPRGPEGACRRAHGPIIYLVDPNNPLGIRYTREEDRELCGDCARLRRAGLVATIALTADFADGHTAGASRGAGRPPSFPRAFRNGSGLAGPADRRLSLPPRICFEELALDVHERPRRERHRPSARRRPGLSVKAEWMKKVRSIDRGNKAMIQEAAGAIEGLGAADHAIAWKTFWCWRPSRAGIRPRRRLVECYRPAGHHGSARGTYHTQRFGDRLS